MSEIVASPVEYRTKVRAIVKFGHAHPSMGERGGEFFQVVIDPNMCSPSGEYIRFDQRFQQHSEIHGWQRVTAITVCEVLGDAEDYPIGALPKGYCVEDDAVVTLRTVNG